MTQRLVLVVLWGLVTAVTIAACIGLERDRAKCARSGGLFVKEVYTYRCVWLNPEARQ